MISCGIVFFSLAANVRVYDQLRHQSDSVSRYTKVQQRDNIRNLMPSNGLYTLLAGWLIP